LNAADNRELDGVLERLLMLLSSFFLQRRAHKVLEHLLRAYAVHTHNVDALMQCALPYHESPTFTRLLALLKIKRTRWAFAGGVALRGGLALTRATLAKRCSIDAQLLTFIAATAARRDAPRLWIAFYALTLSDALREARPRVDDSLLQPLLAAARTSVEASGESRWARAHRQAGALLLGAACARTRIGSRPALLQLIDALVAAAEHHDATRAALLALAQLCRTQRLAAPLAAASVDRLLRGTPTLAARLVELAATRIDVAPLAGALLVALVPRCVAADLDALRCCAALLRVERLATRAPAPLAASLLASLPTLHAAHVDARGNVDDVWRALLDVLRALDTHHAALLDRALARAVESHTTTTAANDDGGGADIDLLLRVVGQALPGTRHAPLPDQRCTLGAALSHSTAQLRVAALSRLGDILVQVSTTTDNDNGDIALDRQQVCDYYLFRRLD
jgi:U3 small nucleolar RNA-associated protein 10